MKRRIIFILLAVCVMMSVVSVPRVEAATDNTVVARMTLFSYTKNVFDTGHSWLYFENLSDESIVVGVYSLAPGEAVSVGTFKNTRSDGAGIYYNVEAYCVDNYGANGRVSISEDITADELKTINQVINSNNHWSLVKNCAWFAAKVWNSVSDTTVFSGSTPSCLKTSIKVESRYNYQKNQEMSAPSAEQVYKQKGDNLVIVSSGSLKKPL